MRAHGFRRPDREGFALVTSLLIILVLSLIAVAAVILSSTEKQTSFAESVHNSAVFSADSGGEAAIHFLRQSDSPPRIIDFVDGTVHTEDDEQVMASQEFDYECQYVRKRPKPGWGVNFLDYDYRVESEGRASTHGRSDVDLVASRLFREGY
jgi:competence protein ComGC